MSKIPLIILGLNETGLYVAQSIAKYKIQVYGFDYDIQNPGFFSRYIKSFHGAHPFHEPEKLLEQIIEKAREWPSKPVLIGSSEDYLDFIQRYTGILKQLFRFVIPDTKVILKILNRAGQFEMAESCNLLVPDYSIIHTKTDLELFLKKFVHHRTIIKALDQPLWKANVTKKAFIIGNPAEISEVGNYLIESNIPFIIQQVIPGPCTDNYEYNALMIDGRVIESSVIQKLRQYPPDYGPASCIRISLNNEVEKLGYSFITQNNIEGFSNTEFKFNHINGEYYFIETNARVWTQIRLTEYNRQNYILEYYNRLVENPIISKLNRGNEIIKWIDVFSDFLLWWRFLRKEKINFYNYLHSLCKVKYFGLLNIKDLHPFFHTIMQIDIFKFTNRRN